MLLLSYKALSVSGPRYLADLLKWYEGFVWVLQSSQSHAACSPANSVQSLVITSNWNKNACCWTPTSIRERFGQYFG